MDNNLKAQIEQYVDNLLIEKRSYKRMMPESLEQVRDDLIAQVEKIMNMAMLTSLPKEDADRCVSLIEQKKHEEAMKIIDEKAENLGENVSRALATFRVQYLKGSV